MPFARDLHRASVEAPWNGAGRDAVERRINGGRLARRERGAEELPAVAFVTPAPVIAAGDRGEHQRCNSRQDCGCRKRTYFRLHGFLLGWVSITTRAPWRWFGYARPA